jgi:hypothetical protein
MLAGQAERYFRQGKSFGLPEYRGYFAPRDDYKNMLCGSN